MANMHLITGYAGKLHVTAADQGSLYAALFGSGSFVLDRGGKLAATVVSNNSISIADGDILMQGRHGRIENGLTVDLAIDNGAAGYKRNDLIVARYTKAAATGVEEINLVVIKGTAVTGTAADPEYISGDILGGATQADFPLYRVPLDGLNVGTLVPLFDLFGTISAQVQGVVAAATEAQSTAETAKANAATAQTAANAAQTKADAAMPKSGGIFTGAVTDGSANAHGKIRNIVIYGSPSGESVNTGNVLMYRK